MDGSPPCPPFSMAGSKRGVEQGKDCIWNETNKTSKTLHGK